MAKRIVLATFGSLGDLHPFLALAHGLLARGCSPIIATHELYRTRVEAYGIGFAALRPDYDPTRSDLNLLSMHPWRGTELILREGLFPHLRETYDDLGRATQGASLLVSHSIVFPAPILAEMTGIPWVSAVLSPLAFMSANDPSHPAPVPWLNRIWSCGPRASRMLIGLIRNKTEAWCEPIRQFRNQLGLPRGPHPLFEGQHSSRLSLAMFSSAIGSPQADWPGSARQTGFCFLDDTGQMPPDLERFLADGTPPLIFTLGSAAVLTAGDFFVESARAVRDLGCRAVLIAGNESRVASCRDLFVAKYAPYSLVFARSAAVVHQGGIGTTGQCLRAGAPALIVPFAHDQPDNAARIVRNGLGLSISRSRYSATRATRELRLLLSDPAYSERAKRVANQLTAENGVDAACRALLEQI